VTAASVKGDLPTLLLDHVPAAAAMFDCEMRYIAWNRRWMSNYRLKPKNIAGRSHYDIFPEISAQWREIHRRAISGETLSSDFEEFRRLDGSVDWVEWEIMPWRNADGEIGGVLLLTHVMHDPMLSAPRLRSLSNELNLLIDSTWRHAICLLDLQGNVTVWNVGAERLYGWSAKETVGKSHEFLFTHEDRASGLPGEHLARAVHEQIVRTKSWRLRKDGSRFLAECTISQIVDENRAVIGFGNVVRDTTADAQRISQIMAREAQLHSILETVPDAMITIDESGTIESFSATAEVLFGYNVAEVMGQNISMLMPEPVARKHDGYLNKYLSTGERKIIGKMRRMLGRRKDGSIFPHELYVGEATGGGRRVFTGFVRDLTRREAAAANLRDVQSELFHISRVSAVGTMATALAHELNQPLTAIANYVQSSAALLNSEQDPPFPLIAKALARAGEEALRAGAIIHRVRDFVAKGELDRSICSVSDLVAGACALASDGSAQSSLGCSVEISPDVASVLVDRVQIQQVLFNLIRNASEAMNGGGSIDIRARQQTDGMVEITVEDHGPGLPDGGEEAVFEPFVSTKATGMGLGLAICRTIVEAHGGRLWCANAKHGGAAFSFTIPVSEAVDD